MKFKLLKERLIQKAIFLERTTSWKFLFTPFRFYTYLNFERYYKISFDFPTVLFIEPTNKCNLRCVFCPRIKSSKKIGYMDFKLFKKIIDECIGHKKLCELDLHKDGEPLLAPNLLKMIKYAKESGISNKVAFASNGILLNEKKSKQILESGLDELTISLDAVTNETYKKIKGVAAFETVENNTKRFIEMRNEMGLKEPLVRVKIVYMKDNIHEVNDFVKKWKSIADSVPVRVYLTWGGSVEDKDITPIKPIKEPYPCPTLFGNRQNGLAVNWDGEVSVCCVDWNKQLIVGDVKKESIYDIWHGEKVKQLRLRHLKGDLEGLQCKTCDFKTSLPRMNLFLRRKLMKKTLAT